MSTKMKLIGDALSPFAVRVIIAARYKGIELEVIPAAGGSRTAEHLARNPIGKVPVLLDGELVLPESDVIVNYLEDRAPTPTLYPGDARQRANARLVARLIDAYSVPSFSPFLRNDAAAIAVAKQRIADSLRYIDHFRFEGEFAAGPAFSIADCALIPFFNAFEALQNPHATYDLVREYPRLDAWWQRARESELGQFARAEIGRAVSAYLRTLPTASP
jgi:glutathione S-transferase